MRPKRVNMLAWAVAIALTGTPLSVSPQNAPAQSAAPVAVRVKQITVEGANAGAVRLDGRLDDAAWAQATFHSDFEQKGNDRSYAPRVRTEVAFLRDDDALYVGARMQNDVGGAPRVLLGRRDEVGNAERILVSLDTHHDLTTAYTFGVTVGGVRIDHMHARDLEGWKDDSFDPVWEARVHADAESWTAELRIPFSQLRFSAAGARSSGRDASGRLRSAAESQPRRTGEQIWGLNVRRWNPTTYLDVYWVVIPYQSSGWASRFGELRGLGTLSARSRTEITPYVLGRATALDQSFGGDGRIGTEGRIGGDLKVGIGSNLTLDATVNPDFGQVEADPARVNLTAFETYFPEHRPFFLEGREIFRTRGPNWFYSRRIGAITAPAGDVARFERVENATILGGAKLTGRLDSGQSVGGLFALTQGERAPEPRNPASPLRQSAAGTAFLVGRVQQELGTAGSAIGITVTGVQRSLEKGGFLEARLPSQALAAGVDWSYRFGSSAYELTGFLGGSRVAGSRESLSFLQRTTGHFFQRPDAKHVEFDSLRTSLDGWTGGVNVSKIGGEPWLWSLDVAAASPGFEIRDAGSQVRSDLIEARASVSGVWRHDTGPLRVSRLGLGLASGWNFDGVRRLLSPSIFLASSWANLWTTSLQLGVTGAELSDDLARGGPLMRAPAAIWGEFEVNSPTSNSAWWHVKSTFFDDDAGGWSASLNAGLSVTAGKALELGILGGGSKGEDSRQFLVTLSGGPPRTYGWRNVFSHLQRKDLFAQFRAKIAFAPDAVLTLYAEPFASTGVNRDFGELAEPGSKFLRVYGAPGSGSWVIPLEDGALQVHDALGTFRIENYDYWVRSFRATGVLRWEWRPGSTVFLIWQKTHWNVLSEGGPAGAGELLKSMGDPGEDILLVKVSFLLGGS
jgi:hypothetical protein